MGRLSALACLGLALAVLLAGEASAKRAGPKAVAPVVHKGVQYEAVNDNGLEGKVVARILKTGEKFWEVVVYTVKLDPQLEQDVQWVFITSLAVHGKSLVVTNEKGDCYLVDLKTGKAVR